MSGSSNSVARRRSPSRSWSVSPAPRWVRTVSSRPRRSRIPPRSSPRPPSPARSIPLKTSKRTSSSAASSRSGPVCWSSMTLSSLRLKRRSDPPAPSPPWGNSLFPFSVVHSIGTFRYLLLMNIV